MSHVNIRTIRQVFHEYRFIVANFVDYFSYSLLQGAMLLKEFSAVSKKKKTNLKLFGTKR